MKEFFTIVMAVWHARKIQDYLWEKPGTPADVSQAPELYQAWLRNMKHRLDCLRLIDPQNPHWRVQARKRALQLSALSIAFIKAINSGKVEP